MTYNTAIMRKNLNPQTQGVPYMSRVFDAVMQWYDDGRTQEALRKAASDHAVEPLDILDSWDTAKE